MSSEDLNDEYNEDLLSKVKGLEVKLSSMEIKFDKLDKMLEQNSGREKINSKKLDNIERLLLILNKEKH